MTDWDALRNAERRAALAARRARPCRPRSRLGQRADEGAPTPGRGGP